MSIELKLHNTIENFLENILNNPHNTLSLFNTVESYNLLFQDLLSLGCDFFDLIRIYANADKVNLELAELVASKVLPSGCVENVSLNKLNSLIPHWTGTKYHSGNKQKVLQDITDKVQSFQTGVHIYNSNLNTRNPRAYNDVYILIVSNQKNIFIDVNRRKTHEILRDLSYNSKNIERDVNE